MGVMLGNPNQNGGARSPVCKDGEVHYLKMKQEFEELSKE